MRKLFPFFATFVLVFSAIAIGQAIQDDFPNPVSFPKMLIKSGGLTLWGAATLDGGTQNGPETFNGTVAIANTANKGSITLSAGSGTATVLSGCTPTCTDSTANASVKCVVASTTLTATGTGTDVINFHCF